MTLEDLWELLLMIWSPYALVCTRDLTKFLGLILLMIAISMTLPQSHGSTFQACLKKDLLVLHYLMDGGGLSVVCLVGGLTSLRRYLQMECGSLDLTFPMVGLLD